MNKKEISFEYHNICIHTHTNTHTRTPIHIESYEKYSTLFEYHTICKHTHTHTCLLSAAQTKNLVEYDKSNLILFEHNNIHTHTYTQTQTHTPIHIESYISYSTLFEYNTICNTRTHIPACCRLPRRRLSVKIMSLIQC